VDDIESSDGGDYIPLGPPTQRNSMTTPMTCQSVMTHSEVYAMIMKY
jgi:hypothetical protein